MNNDTPISYPFAWGYFEATCERLGADLMSECAAKGIELNEEVIDILDRLIKERQECALDKSKRIND